ncbi:MAG: hypothetical protein ACPGMR_07750 [Pontibacterium sp.]
MPVLIILVTLFVVWGIFIYRAQSKKQQKAATQAPVSNTVTWLWVVMFGLSVLIILLTVLGRLPWLFGLIASAAPVIMRLVLANKLKVLTALTSVIGMLLKRRKAAKSSSSPEAIEDTTLGHEISGLLVTLYLPGHPKADKGEHGQLNATLPTDGQTALEALSPEQYVRCFKECQSQDALSAELLSHYLSARFGDDWKADCDITAPALERPMTLEDAHRLLGTSNSHSPSQLRLAHQRLVTYFSDDKDQNAYLLDQLEQAFALVTK